MTVRWILRFSSSRSLDNRPQQPMTAREGVRALAGLLAGALVFAGFVWYLVLRATHDLIADDWCNDVGDCHTPEPARALFHDLAAGVGMIGLLLSIGYGFNFATTNTRLAGFLWSLGLMATGAALWLGVIFGWRAP
jgi:hypothetical protein